MSKFYLILFSFSTLFCFENRSLKFELIGKEFVGLEPDGYTDLLINPARIQNLKQGFYLSLSNLAKPSEFGVFEPYNFSNYLMLLAGKNSKFGIITNLTGSYDYWNDKNKLYENGNDNELYISYEEEQEYGKDINLDFNAPLIFGFAMGKNKFGLMLEPGTNYENDKFLMSDKDIDSTQDEVDNVLNNETEIDHNKFYSLLLTMGYLIDAGNKEGALALRIGPVRRNYRAETIEDAIDSLGYGGYQEVTLGHSLVSQVEEENGWGFNLNVQGRWFNQFSKNLMLDVSYQKTKSTPSNTDLTNDLGSYSFQNEIIDFEQDSEISVWSYNYKRDSLKLTLGFSGKLPLVASNSDISLNYLFGIRPELVWQTVERNDNPRFDQYFYYSIINEGDTEGYREDKRIEDIRKREFNYANLSIPIPQALELSFKQIKLIFGYSWTINKVLISKVKDITSYRFDSTYAIYTEGPQTGQEEVKVEKGETDDQIIDETHGSWKPTDAMRFGVVYEFSDRGEVIIMNLPFSLEYSGTVRKWFFGFTYRF